MLSVVIPLFDEVESLPTLYREIVEVASAASLDLEIIFIDDGSTDGSWEVVSRLAASDPRVHGLRFRRNFGKAAALSAGFQAARGERIVTLDADLQDDPHEIPRLLTQMDLGFDVVSGWKRVRHDPWHKVLPSRVFNWMVSAATGVLLHDHNCGLKAYRRDVFDEVRLYGEMHRFVPVLAHARGFKVSELVVNHRPRAYGCSKYGVRRFIKGFLDLLTVKFLTVFGQRPQHLLGTLGLICFLAGGAGLAYLGLDWLIARVRDVEVQPFHHLAVTLFSLTALIIGVQLMSIGFVAEMVASHSGRRGETYSIAEETPAAAQPSEPSLHERSA